MRRAAETWYRTVMTDDRRHCSMTDALDSVLPETSTGMFFAFLTLFLVVLPLTVVLAAEAPWLLALLVGLGFLGWVLAATGVLPDLGDDASESVDPLATLQDEYARGAIDEAEFERRLERLAETGALDRDRESAAGRTGVRGGEAARETGQDREVGRDHETEREVERE